MKDKYSAGLVQTEIREEWRTIRNLRKRNVECVRHRVRNVESLKEKEMWRV